MIFGLLPLNKLTRMILPVTLVRLPIHEYTANYFEEFLFCKRFGLIFVFIIFIHTKNSIIAKDTQDLLNTDLTKFSA